MRAHGKGSEGSEKRGGGGENKKGVRKKGGCAAPPFFQKGGCTQHRHPPCVRPCRWMSEMLFNLTQPLDIHRMDNRLCLWSQIVGSQLSPSLPAFFQFRSTFKRLGCSVWKGIWSCTKAMYVRPCFVPLAVTGSPGYRYRHTRAGYGNWTAIVVHTFKTLQSKVKIFYKCSEDR